MAALGGSFEIRSSPGQGTEATLRLPLMALPPKEQPSQAEGIDLSAARPVEPIESRSGLNAHHIRLLVVDDHAMVREGLRSLLESYADVQVVGEARNGREAIEASAHAQARCRHHGHQYARHERHRGDGPHQETATDDDR